MAAAGAVLPPALAALSQGVQWEQDIVRAVRRAVVGVDRAGRLPIVKRANLEARVNPTVLSVPYIHRDEEATLRAHLRARRPVLLIGSSMVGKTRMAARVLKEEFGSWPVFIPDSKTALADLDAKDISLRSSVIWLDDIDRLIVEGGITDGSLRQLAAAGNVIVGTIRARKYDEFRPSDQLQRPEWDVLSVFARVIISRYLTEREQEQLARAVDSHDIRERIRAVGLGEYVGAAGQIAEELKLGAAGANDLGYALVLAAANWRRCGMTRPVPTSVLTSLAASFLDQPGRARLADQAAFDNGLNWATRDINPSVSLLRPAGDGSYTVYDYALDLISEQGIPIPAGNWDVIITNAEASELVTIAFTAEVTYHRTETAIQAFRTAASSERPDVAPQATLFLGLLLELHEDVDGAKAAYQQAIDSGHADVAPEATVQMGELLERQGDVDGAKAAYQQAIGTGHPDTAPLAALRLGALLHRQGDVDGAKAAYQQAIGTGHPQTAPLAARNLGLLLQEQGDADGAKAAYQQAIDSQEPDAASGAALFLGMLLQEQGDVDGAKAAYQQATGIRQSSAAPEAAFRLGTLLQRQGDVEGAKAAYQQAIDSERADVAPQAAFHLGMLLFNRDKDGAKAAYQQAIDFGHPDTVPEAALWLGVLLQVERDTDGAKAAYRQAIGTGHPDIAPRATRFLGVLLQEQGDVEGAKAAYQQAIDSGHADVAPEAAFNLGVLLQEQGDTEGAKAAYQQAINSGHAAVTAKAASHLALLTEDLGDADTDGAKAAR
jgi:tetratricopeptide (TPR) repeat protein